MVRFGSAGDRREPKLNKCVYFCERIKVKSIHWSSKMVNSMFETALAIHSILLFRLNLKINILIDFFLLLDCQYSVLTKTVFLRLE